MNDTMLMFMKWMMTGGEAVTSVMFGAPRAFALFDRNSVSVAAKGIDYIPEFFNDELP